MDIRLGSVKLNVYVATSPFVQSMLANCGATLKSLTLANCYNVEDKDIEAITQHCPQLEELGTP